MFPALPGKASHEFRRIAFAAPMLASKELVWRVNKSHSHSSLVTGLPMKSHRSTAVEITH